MEDKSVSVVSGIITAAIIGGLIWAFIRHTKLALLILLGLILVTVGIVVALAVYDKKRGFKTVGEQKLQERVEGLILRIRRSRRFSSSAKDALANSYCGQLMQLAEGLLSVIKNTPDSEQKTALITQRTDLLEDAVKKLEQLNLTTALMDAGQLQALSDDFQLTIEAMQEAESAVSGVPMPSKPAEETQQLYRSEQ